MEEGNDSNNSLQQKLVSKKHIVAVIIRVTFLLTLLMQTKIYRFLFLSFFLKIRTLCYMVFEDKSGGGGGGRLNFSLYILSRIV